jgi:hypothetical protein
LDDRADAAAKHWTAERERNIAAGLILRRPHVHVYWCFPVFPGVFLANSEYCAGSMAAEWGTKLLVFDGFRTRLICWVGPHWMS